MSEKKTEGGQGEAEKQIFYKLKSIGLEVDNDGYVDAYISGFSSVVVISKNMNFEMAEFNAKRWIDESETVVLRTNADSLNQSSQQTAPEGKTDCSCGHSQDEHTFHTQSICDLCGCENFDGNRVLKSRLAESEAERERLERDVENYRLLLENCHNDVLERQSMIESFMRGNWQNKDYRCLEAELEAARREADELREVLTEAFDAWRHGATVDRIGGMLEAALESAGEKGE